MTSSSGTIQAELDRIGGRRVGATGEGDGTCILWELGDGRRVIETNGDPVWEGEDGFDAVAAACEANG
jgi:hypothetical protein